MVGSSFCWGHILYVRTSSEACAETTWMHAQATHPQTNSDVEQESDAACMLSAEADHNSLWSIREQVRR